MAGTIAKLRKRISEAVPDGLAKLAANDFRDDDLDSEDERYGLMRKLQRLASFAGESIDLAIDPATEVLYCVDRLTPIRLDALSTDALIANVTAFGTARWYFAFFEPAADDVLNIDVAKEFTRAMKPFAAKKDLVRRIAARTKAVAAYRAKVAAAEKAAEKAEAKAAARPDAAIREIAKDAADNTWNISWILDPDALIAGLRAKKLRPNVSWKYLHGISCLPADLLSAVLSAKRDGKQDQSLWGRVDQLIGVTIPPGTKLDPLVADAATVAAIIGGERAKKTPARYAKIVGELLYTPPTDRTNPSFRSQEERARYERDRVGAIGEALVGKKAFVVAVEATFRATLYDRNLRYAQGVLLLAARVITFEDAFNISQKTDDVGTLAELGLAKGWKRAKIEAECDRLGVMFQVDAWRAAAKVLAE